MRVAHVVHNMQIGGLEKVVANLMRVQRGGGDVDPMLICVGTGGELISEVEAAGVPVEVLGKRRGFKPRMVLRVSGLLRHHRVEVAHCHNLSGMIYGALGARLARTPAVVYTAHGAETAADRRQGIFRRLGLIHRWITVSEDARQVAIELAGGSAQTVQAVINGVDLSLYESADGRDRVRSELDIDASEYVFGIVARLSDAKDHHGLIDAFGRAFAGRDDVSLLVVGDGELRETVERLARRSPARIRLTGARRDIPDLLAAMDAFVLSSHTEGLAVTLLEAGASGLPVVATRVGGNTEVVLDDETGKLVPARDPASLAEAMAWIEAHRDEARRMGAAGRARVRDNFSVESMARRYFDVYEQALDSK